MWDTPDCCEGLHEVAYVRLLLLVYANTLLGTLNTRKLRERKHNSPGSYSLPVIFSDNFPGKSSPDNHTSRRGDGRHYVSEVCLIVLAYLWAHCLPTWKVQMQDVSIRRRWSRSLRKTKGIYDCKYALPQHWTYPPLYSFMLLFKGPSKPSWMKKFSCLRLWRVFILWFDFYELQSPRVILCSNVLVIGALYEF